MSDVDSEEDIASAAENLRMHAKFLADAAEEAAEVLDSASKELEILREVQWIVNRDTGDSDDPPGTAEDAIRNARELVAVADEYLAWRDLQGGTPGTPPNNQQQVAAWIRIALGEESAANGPERSLRLVEEAVELAQALGVGADEIHRLVDYVFKRPDGNAEREIAGCQVTLYGVASAIGVDVEHAFAEELVRIHQPEVIERVQRRQKEKREVTSGDK